MVGGGEMTAFSFHFYVFLYFLHFFFKLKKCQQDFGHLFSSLELSVYKSIKCNF